MEKLEFLLVVAIGAVILIGFVFRMERKHRAKVKARHAKTHHKAQLHHRYETGNYHHIHGHVAETMPHGEMWASRHKRAGDEDRSSSAIAATRLYSDDEEADDRIEAGLRMASIEYKPEELTKRSSTPRR